VVNASPTNSRQEPVPVLGVDFWIGFEKSLGLESLD
jgi:hypothetical protein